MMATAPTTNLATLADAGRSGEIRTRLLFLAGALIVYRIGTFIQVPGINQAAVLRYFTDQSNSILGVGNSFRGGAPQRPSIFPMGVIPYISASLIIPKPPMGVPTRMEHPKG